MTDVAPGSADSQSTAPLAGVIVLELGQIYCGPYCGFLLARMGAEVIKIEPPTGELSRHRTQPGVEPVALTLLNTNKSGVRLNLKTDQGKAVLRSLAERADVLIENFAPGVMDRLGVGYEVLRNINPRLIYASATGFGQYGPYSQLGAMDLTVQAMTGVMTSNGFADAPPVKAGVAVADFAGGTHLALAVAVALYQRHLTGLGQRVDVSMQDALLPTLTSNISGYITNGESHPPRTGNQHGSLSVSPYNLYPTSDGFVAILCAADRHWTRLCDVMNRGDLGQDETLATMRSRAARNEEIDEIIGAWTISRTRAEIVSDLMEAGIPVAPVLTVPEVLEDKHLLERKMIQTIEHPTLGKIRAFGSPVQFSGSEPVQPTPSPLLGEHTADVLKKFLGFDDVHIDELRAGGVI